MEITHHQLRQLLEIFAKSIGINSINQFNCRQGSNLHMYIQGAANALEYAVGSDESLIALRRQLIEILGMIKENFQVIIEVEKE